MAISSNIEALFGLSGRIAVVTGAGSGLGREIARVLDAAGARVAIVDLDDEGMKQTAELMCNAALTYHVDISSRDEVESLASQVTANTGRLDIWVNCAGLGYIHPLLEADPETAARVVAVNMMGTYWCCTAAGRAMSPLGGGSIVNIASMSGIIA